MTTTESIAETTRRSQETFLQIWANGVQTFLGLPLATDTKEAVKAPSPEEVVDNAFNFAEKVLATQREYIKSWLAAVKSMNSSTAWLAQSAVKDTNSKKI